MLGFERITEMEGSNLIKCSYHTHSQMSITHLGPQWSNGAGMIIHNPSTDHQVTSNLTACSQLSSSTLLGPPTNSQMGQTTNQTSHNLLSDRVGVAPKGAFTNLKEVPVKYQGPLSYHKGPERTK